MKSYIKYVGLICFCIGSLLSAAGQYFCPMRCEGKKTYAVAGQCPVCHMDLEAEAAPLNDPSVRVDLELSPKQPTANQPVRFVLTPKTTATNQTLKDLSSLHGKKMYVTVVSQDLSFIAPVALDPDNGGAFNTELTLPEAGTYVAFSEFAPSGKAKQVLPLRFEVSGPKAKQAKFANSTSFRKKVGEQELELVGLAPKNQSKDLKFEVRSYHKGKSISWSDPKLSGPLHVFAVSSDLTQFVHKTIDLPRRATDPLKVALDLPQPGQYRTWVLLSYDKRPVAAGFGVTGGKG